MAEREESEADRDLAEGRPRRRTESEERARAEELERAVYGKPISMHVEPSIGTRDTPPPTEEMLPIHPGGVTKQGDNIEDEPHLPHMISMGSERRSPRSEGTEATETTTSSWLMPFTAFRGFLRPEIIVSVFAVAGMVVAFLASASAFAYRVEQED